MFEGVSKAMDVLKRATVGLMAGLSLALTQVQEAAATECGEALLQQMDVGAIEYQLSWKGLALEGKRQIERLEDGNWLARNDSRLLFMGLEERSRFGFDQGGVRSIEYRYQRKGMSKKRDLRQQFGRDGQFRSISPRGDAEVSFEAPVYDLLNHQVQMQIDLACAPPRELYRYPVARRDKVDNFDYRRVAEESVQTPAGRFDAIRLERGDPKDFLDQVWFAPALNYAIVKLERLEDGEKAQLVLTRYPGQAAAGGSQ